MLSGMKDGYLRERIQNSGVEEDSVTNEVFDTRDGTLVKVFSSCPVVETVFGLFGPVLGRYEFPTRRARKRREVAAKESMSSAGFTVPEILYEADTALELQKIEQEPVTVWMESAAEAGEMGGRVGSFLRRVHNQGFALLDTNLDNFLTDGENIFSIDHEYFSVDATRREIWFDPVMLYASSLTLDPARHRSFLEGFETSYGSLGYTHRLLGIPAAFIMEFGFKRDLELGRNIVINLLTALKGRI